jgi:hypothetical protein
MKLFCVVSLLIFVTAASPSLYSQVAAQHSGPVACPTPTAATPVWGKLVVAGSTVTCYYATGTAQPTAWVQLGQPKIISFINNPLLVGIFITAHNASALSTGTIDNFSITPAPTYRLMDVDIGTPTLMGVANLTAGVWSITGSGTDIWNTADQFNFQPWLVWGDCTVVCRVTSLSVGDPWQKIGIMVRDGFNSGSDYASFCDTYKTGVDFQYRVQFNNNPDVTPLVASPAPGIASSIPIGYGLTGSIYYTLRP